MNAIIAEYTRRKAGRFLAVAGEVISHLYLSYCDTESVLLICTSHPMVRLSCDLLFL